MKNLLTIYILCTIGSYSGEIGDLRQCEIWLNFSQKVKIVQSSSHLIFGEISDKK